MDCRIIFNEKVLINLTIRQSHGIQNLVELTLKGVGLITVLKTYQNRFILSENVGYSLYRVGNENWNPSVI